MTRSDSHPGKKINSINEGSEQIVSIILKNAIECRTNSTEIVSNSSTDSTKVLLNESNIKYGTMNSGRRCIFKIIYYKSCR